MPGLIEFYESYSEHRDKFEILAFHDATVANFAELDEKLIPIKKNLWDGKDLPFPILLDSTRSTLKAFGISYFPTIVLIDPEGKLVGDVGLEALEEKLPPLPIAVRLAQAVDRQVMMSVDSTPLDEAIEKLAEAARVPIRLDEEKLGQADVVATQCVPLTLAGRLSLRSWLNLVLEAQQLTFTLQSDAIVVTPRAAGQGPPLQDSAAQLRCFQRIEARLKENSSFDFQETPLSAVAAFLEKQSVENFILDPTALEHGRLDPDMKVTGSADDIPLGPALEKLLNPLDVTYVIRDELVVLTPLSDDAAGGS